MPTRQKLAPAFLVSILFLSGCATTSGQQTSSTPSPSETSLDLTQPPVITEQMTDTEIVLAALMGPDGEYAAAASYEAVLNEYGMVEPYATIYQAELRHIDALIRQLEKLGVEVPANPYTGKIKAPGDLVTAATAWAEGEILNVELYDALIKKTSNENLLKVLGNLRRASLDSHLPAFQLAAKNGGTLTPEQMARR